ncbi:MAG: cytochrome c3 family protein [Candidatus Latescibacteria bacterium]|nr:cytochrome c3 family protein [Candidatus Latescibacterota bacterium]
MPQIFTPAANTVAKASIVGGFLLVASLLSSVFYLGSTSYVTRQQDVRPQPVPFSHRHHVNQLGIDCRYCHTSVEESNFAGLPQTKTCMSCHSMVWTDAPMLEPVRESYATGESLEWVRVHDLPDYVYFNHSIHVNKGIGCESCHGAVNEMALMFQENSLQMMWCLECHRNPEAHIRDRADIYKFESQPDYDPPADQLALGEQLVRSYKVNKIQLEDCSICHR